MLVCKLVAQRNGRNEGPRRKDAIIGTPLFICRCMHKLHPDCECKIAHVNRIDKRTILSWSKS